MFVAARRRNQHARRVRSPESPLAVAIGSQIALRELSLLHARVAVPLDLFELTRSYIYLEGTKESHSTLPVFLRNTVMPGRQRNPEPALIVRREGCNREVALLHVKGRMRKRF